jgi:hypothetical protein
MQTEECLEDVQGGSSVFLDSSIHFFETSCASGYNEYCLKACEQSEECSIVVCNNEECLIKK